METTEIILTLLGTPVVHFISGLIVSYTQCGLKMLFPDYFKKHKHAKRFNQISVFILSGVFGLMAALIMHFRDSALAMAWVVFFINFFSGSQTAYNYYVKKRFSKPKED